MTPDLLTAALKARDATGWAICDGGNIIVSTVSPTRLTAIINWLVTERCMMVFNSDPVEKIEASWQSMKLNAECIEVKICSPQAIIDMAVRENTAFTRGYEAARENAAKVCDANEHIIGADMLAEAIRALPTPSKGG